MTQFTALNIAQPYPINATVPIVPLAVTYLEN